MQKGMGKDEGCKDKKINIALPSHIGNRFVYKDFILYFYKKACHRNS
jgi:hypothetical protein